MLTNLRVIRKSLRENWESSEVFGFVSSLTADHYFWCSADVPCCFEGVLGYYGMFHACSAVVPGCSGLFRGYFGVFRGVLGCSGVHVFRGVPGFTDNPQKIPIYFRVVSYISVVAANERCFKFIQANSQ